MLIGITGKSGSGKDEIARYIKHGFAFNHLTFAKPIKDMVAAIYGLDVDTLEATGFKEKPIPGIGKSLRELYQTLGTDWGRNMIDRDIWVRHMAKRLQGLPRSDVVISDVRFDNEALFIRANGGVIIHVTREAAKRVRDHASENGINRQHADIVIVNDSTIEALYNKISDTMGVIIQDEFVKNSTS